MKPNEANNRIEEIKKCIENKNTKYVSFDVFDTLITRPVKKPTDLFDIVEYRINKIKKYKDFKFKKIRIKSEKMARQKMKKNHPDYEDINFNEIYETMLTVSSLSKDDISLMKKIELEVEQEYLKPREIVTPLYQLALAKGKKVIIVSDMYLPTNDIKDILDHNKYTNISSYFVSSNLRKSKSHGGMFNYVMKTLNCKPDQICHIGDNKKSDKKMADNVGIKAFHLPKTSLEIDTNNKSYFELHKDQYNSIGSIDMVIYVLGVLVTTLISMKIFNKYYKKRL